MKLFKSILISILATLVLISCQTKDKLAVDVANIDVKFDISRFDQIFYNATPQTFAEVKSAFPYLFPSQEPDSVWLNKIKNQDNRFLYTEVQKTFPDFKPETDGLTELFKHVKYYYPKFNAPKVVTLISEVDYLNKVIYADSLLLVSLDMYLGSQHEVYAGFPQYLSATFDKKYLLADVSKAIAHKNILKQDTQSFINSCIQQGKLLYQSKAFLPTLADSTLMGYNSNQINWAQANEEFIWKYFVENQLIYSTDKNLMIRFIDQAPFSKFYLENDRDTPSEIGTYIGYQIVKSFIKNNEVSLNNMLLTPNETIFKKSKYKPRNDAK